MVILSSIQLTDICVSKATGKNCLSFHFLYLPVSRTKQAETQNYELLPKSIIYTGITVSEMRIKCLGGKNNIQRKAITRVSSYT
jgi:hypothetical protein